MKIRTNIRTLLILALVLLLSSNQNIAQNVGIGAESFTPDANSMLEVKSDNKGFLPPRLELVQTTSYAPLPEAHVAGMVVYNTATTGDVTPGLYVNDGSKWISLEPQIYTAGTGIGITNNVISASGGASGGLIGIRTLTNTTLTTYEPTEGTNSIKIILVGGGGRGGGGSGSATSARRGGGGAGGNALVKFIPNFTGTATFQCGLGGSSSGNANGGSTTFTYSGTTYTANGGNAGQWNTNSQIIFSLGGTPGYISTNGDINILGENGKAARTSSPRFGGDGGSSIMGAGAIEIYTNGSGNNATNFGSGGSGADGQANMDFLGGNGRQGIVIIYEYN